MNGKQLLLARRIVLSASLAAAVASLLVAPAVAQGYPNRPVRIVIPFAPGGPTEFIIRLVADRLTATLGQAFVIENRPGGAGGTVGAKSVAVAEPDGYTLLFSSPGPLVTAAAVYKNLDYDPIKSFAPIAMLIYAPQMLVVHPSVPANSLPQFVAYAKSNPGKITFGSSGYGTQPHMLGEMLKRAAGINIIHVPYRGAGQSVTDLVAGQVQMIFETTAILLPHVEGGRLRALAVATDTRSALLPDVPTTTESGYPTLLASFWSGLLAPAGTPAPIVDKLNGAVNDILKSKEAQAGLARLSAEAKLGSPHDFAAFIAAEAPRWAAIANETGIKVD
ncbi:MAG: Bug family tripartite tricarboxylate transporter substrate binding protein [Xanthobacteraceae bacterium]